MRKSFVLGKLAVVALMSIVFQSCSKNNGVDTLSVIATPYSLYYCDSSGTLYNTNDGIHTKNIVFPSDGIPSRAVMIAGPNLLWVKSRAYLTTNSGVNFNPTYTTVNPVAFGQTLLLNAQDENRIYIASSLGGNTGIVYNDNNGAFTDADWHTDNTIDAATTGFRVTSYTELKNNTLIAFDFTSTRLFAKGSKPAPWLEQTTTVVANRLPAGAAFSMGHFNNTVVAVDLIGVNGAYYSDNNGQDWTKYSGLPAGPLYVAASPFDAVLMIGTDLQGIYVLKGGTFVSSNSGLAVGTTVRAIAAKQNIYINGVAQQYVYIATNHGIYRSQDLGQNWTLMKAGNFYSIY
ncbi:MAG: hypothetical protein H0X33_02015 [Taibaiella sp.]|nr:hypothetical protein [Taibaiella sp.]